MVVMKDFFHWMMDQPILYAPELTPAEQHILDLEDADILRDEQDGTFKARCCRCDEWTELPVGPDEIGLDYEHYCGGSPRCCP